MNSPKIKKTDNYYAQDEGSTRLAQAASDGDVPARKRVSEIAHPIISYQTNSFCKRFCKENHYYHKCTLFPDWGSSRTDALFCEWGNASYTWMLDDLTKTTRLKRFKGTDGARLGGYFFHIANSLPFYERWKDWRFGRKVHVPTYIREMEHDAAKVFLALLGGENIPMIAQKLARDESGIEALVHNIIISLTKRKRLHLLDPPQTISLTNPVPGTPDSVDSSGQLDVASRDLSAEDLENRRQLKSAWTALGAAEQFVLEAMLIDDQDAKDVLKALVRLDISLTDGVPATETNQQQLYYFRRKTLIKLEKLMSSQQ
ncbi:MAG: hypothetical protein ACC635_07375 [Acidiferrobacterales bacterium]